ncbi:putative protein kinase RLK-Pelle-LRR-I-1 family [Helianthus anomalus]
MTSTLTMFTSLRIPLEDVVKATNNFQDDYIIQHDGISTTYKGRLLWSGKEMKIAAQRFDCRHVEGDLKFLNEISVLSDFKHTNLVSIIGFSDEKDEKIIITMYEATGSLRQYINSPNLTWKQRLRISVDLAHALSYLHYDEGCDYGVIHCNITSDTILLDENGEAKLSGFEFSIKQSVNYKDQVCPCEHTGTMGCVDPAIKQTGGVTHKSDIYSFGVVLFEILCESKALIHNKVDRSLAQLAKHHYEKGTLHDTIHPPLLNQILSPQSLLIYSKVAYSCLNDDRAHRPDMHYIVAKLEKALELQLRHENIERKFGHLKISLGDIKLATNNFSETYIIASVDGECILYRAELHCFDKENPSSEKGKNKGDHPKGHNIVVIKRYPSGNEWYGVEEFFTEIEMLSSVEHPNTVTLIGFCIEDSEMILVIENVSNGYLDDYLGNDNYMRILTWEKRLKICIDVANALEHLHSEIEDQKMIIHRDICSCNIGLDENWRAKIDGFGDCVFLPPNQEDEAVYIKWRGRSPYIDPEYEKTGKLKRELDVYSFGVVLFEILCGRTAYDPIYKKENVRGLGPVARQSFYMGTLEDMIDPILKDETSENNSVLSIGPNKDSLHTFMKIAYLCVAETQDQRPTMKVVVNELEKALFFQDKNNDKPKLSLEDIKLATQNFRDDNCIGVEGDGKLYKGNLQDGVNTIVAKRLDTSLGQGEKQFLSQLQILWEYKHENVIVLVGYCDEQDEKIIVYEHVSRRSLDKYLNDVCLTWEKRLNICIDVARALDFLHGGGHGKQSKVIHRDIKPTNILLNHDWKAKLADFGLSLLSPITQEPDYVIDHVCGAPGYLDPLFKKSGFITAESDIYSFGVVMFEILCGRSTSAIHEDEGHHLPDFIKNKFEQGKHDEVVFEKIMEQIMPKSLITFQEIAYKCLHHEREKRPTANEVLLQLKKALEFQQRRYIQRKKREKRIINSK